ncbi:MAG TPA: hypothetical protein VHO26_11465 [Propionibacteriaceae bacterium]|nr:hypothetical protein [Propionibacteriaceae bacterium]
MEIERVQKWVMSAVVLTTATVFASGISLLAGQSEQPGAEPGLLSIAAVVGIVAVAAVRVINQKPVLTPWLLLGVLPAAVVGYLAVVR